MGARRKGREFALQMLFQIDMTGQDPQEVTALFWQGRQVLDEARRFAEQLFLGCLEIRTRLDAALARVSEHWKLSRMPVVDRNLLRLGLYEMLFMRDTPRVVVIDEAIEIAKRFGSEDSGQFINGVLDRLRKEIERLEDGARLTPAAVLERLGAEAGPSAEESR